MIKNFAAVLILCLFLPSCRDISESKVIFHEGNVVLPKVSFTSSDDKRFVVEYWPTGNKSFIQKSSESSGRSHAIALLNIRPATKYSYVIRDVDNQTQSDVFDFTTPEIPDDIIQI
jgi:hypothetical protein